MIFVKKCPSACLEVYNKVSKGAVRVSAFACSEARLSFHSTRRVSFGEHRSVASTCKSMQCKTSPTKVNIETLKGFDESKSYFPADFSLPARSGPRPKTMRCLPHAQMTDQSSNEVFSTMLKRANQLLSTCTTVGQVRWATGRTHVICHDVWWSFSICMAWSLPRRKCPFWILFFMACTCPNVRATWKEVCSCRPQLFVWMLLSMLIIPIIQIDVIGLSITPSTNTHTATHFIQAEHPRTHTQDNTCILCYSVPHARI